MLFNVFVKMLAMSLAFVFPNASVNQQLTTPLSDTTKKVGEKELFIPVKVSRVPENNDYKNDEADYSFKHMVQADNIAIFWHKEFGDDPSKNANEKKRFDPNEALKECERFYAYYVNDLKMVQKGKSATDKYKMILYVINGEGGTAFGGGTDKIGMLWTPAARMSKAPYGALAHELGHSFQYMSRLDNGRGPRGAISEMSAQYMLWQVYPEWMTFENYHLIDFMKNTHYAFLHPTNMYHSPYVFEYWSNKYGIEFFGNLCRATQDGEDPVATYKRMNSLSQEQFNDEMFDASRRFITWDMKRIEEVAKQYANQHKSTLTSIGEGWYRIAASNCPQNYGYNGIKLQVPKSGTKVLLNFKGVAGATGFNAVKIDMAGWRYGFLASLKNGKRVYGKVSGDANGTSTFKVPKNTAYLWLVVMGAPTEHWPVVSGRQRTESTPDEQWPYEIKLTGTSLDESVLSKPL